MYVLRIKKEYTKLIALLITVLIAQLLFGTTAHAQRMESTNFQVATDSVNFAGTRSSSASFSLEDTLGEIATGESSSTNFLVKAGYQQTVGDEQAPSIPDGLTAVPQSDSQIQLTWNDSTDDTAVTGYQVFRDGVQIATTTVTSFLDTGLAANTTFSYQVTAFDAVLNISAKSDAVEATTLGGNVGVASGGDLVELRALRILPSEESALLEFSTYANVRYTLSYGRTTAYEMGTIRGSVFGREHIAFINDLTPDTQYYFKIEAETSYSRVETLITSDFRTRAREEVTPFEEGIENVEGFKGMLQGDDVLLSWRNPQNNEFSHVSIHRSADGFPQSPDEGEEIFNGTDRAFRDIDVAALGNEIYYTIFAYDTDGNISSGAIVQIVIDPDNFDFKDVDPVISLEDVFFLQEGNVFSFSEDGSLGLDASKAFQIALPYDVLPERLKTIMLTLGDVEDHTKTFSVLLRINEEKTAYVANIAPLGREGIYPLNVGVFDYDQKEVSFTEGMLTATFSGTGGSYVDSSGAFPWATAIKTALVTLIMLLLLGVIYGLVRVVRRVRHRFGTTLSLFLILTSLIGAQLFPLSDAHAAFNPEINYQGKLTDSSGAIVADGNYDIEFNLYTVSTGGSAIYTENQTVAVENGLFSVLVGDSTSLSGVDFNQELFLGVTVESDSEMTPRKKLGAVPAAFEADRLDGLEASQLLRSDAADTIATSTSSTLLTVNQQGAGDILNLQDNGTEVFTVIDGGLVGIATSSPTSLLTVEGSGLFTNTLQTANLVATGTLTFQGVASGILVTDSAGVVSASNTLDISDNTNLAVSGGLITLSGDTLSVNALATSSIDTEAELEAILTDVTDLITGASSVGDLTDVTLAAAANGEILVHNGSAFVNQATNTLGLGDGSFLGLNDTFSSYTAGSILFTSASGVTQDNANIFWDDTNNRLGIGVADPDETLHVNGSTLIESILSVADTVVKPHSSFGSNSTTHGLSGGEDVLISGDLEIDGDVFADGGTFSISSASTSDDFEVGGALTLSDGSEVSPPLTFTSDRDTGLFRPGTNILGFTTAGSERFRIDASGNVGIGTTSPTSLLTVEGSGLFTDTLETANLTATGTLTFAGVANGILTTDANGLVSASSTIAASNIEDLFLRNNGDTATGDYTFDTNTLVIDATNNRVGVGTTSPTDRFSVSGNARITGFLFIEDRIQLDNNGLITAEDSGGTARSFLTGRDASDNTILTGGNNLIFQTGNASERMRIVHSTGNVGVGTTTPEHLLDVDGDFRVGEVGQANAFFVNATSGRVGVNTATPSVDFEVDGDFQATGIINIPSTSFFVGNVASGYRFNNAANSLNLLRLHDSGGLGLGSSGGFNTTDPGAGIMIIQNALGVGDTTPDFTLEVASTSNANGYFAVTNSSDGDVFVIDENDNVGIGISNPTTKLDVLGTASSSDAVIDNTLTLLGITSGTLFSDSSGNVTATSTLAASNIEDAFLRNNGDTATGDYTFDTDTLVIDATNGRVGVGTASPGARLEIEENIVDSTVGTLLILDSLNQGVGSGGAIQFQNDIVEAQIQMINSGSFDSALAFFTETDGSTLVEQMRIEHNGNVGIGTTNPATTLDVLGTASSSDAVIDNTLTLLGITSGTLFSDSSGNVTATSSLAASNIEDAFLRNDGDTATGDYTFDTNTLVIDAANDRVGVGTTSPVRLLELVGGDTTTSQLRIGNGDLSILANDEIGGIEFFSSDANAVGAEITAIAERTHVNGTIGDTHLTFSTAGDVSTTLSERMRITDTGLVGIGTTTPEHLLDVDGDFRVGEAGSANAFFVDATNGQVGIGSDSPASALDVTGIILARGTVPLQAYDEQDQVSVAIGPESATGDTNAQFQTAGDIAFKPGTLRNGFGRFDINLRGTGGESIFEIGSDTNFGLEGSFTSYLVVLGDSGDVGIGTTTPSGKLHVQSGNASAAFSTSADDVIVENNGPAGITIASDNASTNSIFFADDDSNVGRIVYDHALNDFAIFTNNVERFTIDTNGQVGIGTTTPAAELHIIDTSEQFRIGSDTTNYWSDTVASDGGRTLAGFGSDADFNIDFSNATDGDFSINSDDFFLDTGTGNIILNSTSLEQVSIGNTGNASIPQLNVLSGGSNNEATIYAKSINDINAAFGAQLTLARARATSGGVVTSGDSLGQINFAGGDGTDARTVAASIIAQVDGTPGSNDMPGRLIFSTTEDGAALPTERVRIDSTGNVGIGTTTPTSLLTVEGDGLFTGNLSAANLTATGTVTLGSFTAGSILFATSSGVLSQDNSNFFWDDANDRLGIGTNAPTNKLHVVGAAVITAGATIDGASFDASATSFDINHAGTGGDDISILNNGDLFIGQQGNVGIGTSTPAAKLHVFNAESGAIASTVSDDFIIENSTEAGLSILGGTTGDSNIFFGSSDSSTAGLVGYDHNANLFTIGTGESGAELRFRTGAAAERVRIDSTGNVGIGTTTPRGLLTVSNTGTRQLLFEDTDASADDHFGSISFADGAMTFSGLRDSDLAATPWNVLIDTSGNVGIATTTSLTTRLNVHQSNSTSGGLLVNMSHPTGNNANALEIIKQAGTIGNYISAGNFVVQGDNSVGVNESSPDFIFEIATTTNSNGYFGVSESSDGDVFVISEDGNIGINDSNPGAILLSMESRDASTFPFFISASTAGIGDSTFEVQENGSNNLILNMSNSGDVQTVRVHSSGDSFFDGGSVGIGTTTPAHLLDVDGDFRVGEAGSADAFFVDATNGNVGIGTSTLASVLTVDDSDGTDAIRVYGNSGDNYGALGFSGSTYFISSQSDASDATAIIFRTADSSGVETNAMRIDAAQRVGIIDTTADFRLEIAETVSDGYFGISSAVDNDGDIFIVDGSGNVGIGTTSLQTGLTIESGLDVSVYEDDSNNIATLLSADNFGGQLDVFRNGTSQIVLDGSGGAIFNEQGVGHDFRVEGLNEEYLFYLDSNDDQIGIGTSTPEYLLDVDGDFRVGEAGQSNAFFVDATSGNVGLGTTSPGVVPTGFSNDVGSNMLDIRSENISHDAGINLGRNDSQDIRGTIWYDGNGGDLIIENGFDNSAGAIFLRTRSSATAVDALTILGDGEVGIGTTTPEHLLDVDGDFRVGEAGQSNAFFVDATSGRIGINTASPSFSVDAVGFINTDATTGGYKIDGDTVLQASSTIGDSLFIGTLAGNTTMTGTENIFIGNNVGDANTTGASNVFIGNDAGSVNTEGIRNVFIGKEAGQAHTTGSNNTFIGNRSGEAVTTGGSNTFIGSLAGLSNTTALSNTAVGVNALNLNVLGTSNVALGVSASRRNTGATSTVAIGDSAASGVSNFNAENYVAIGKSALLNIQTGADDNVAIGFNAGAANTTGANNIYLGHQAGNNVTTGSNNLIIGYDIDAPSATGDNQLSIGNLIFGTGIDGTGTSISSGSIGIGTSSPSHRLDVDGDFRVGEAGQSNAFFVDATNGNVGVGTSTPGDNLSVVGNARITTTSGNPLVIDQGSQTNIASLSIINLGAGTTGIDIGPLSIGDNSGNEIQYDVPNKRLRYSVRGSGGGGSSNAAHLFTTDSGASGVFGEVVKVKGGGTGADLLVLTQSDDTEVLTVEYGGNVGIGTSTPDSILSVVDADPILLLKDTDTGQTTAQSRIRFAESATGGVTDQFWDVGAGNDLVGAGDFDFAIVSSEIGTPSLVIDENGGNVAVGTGTVSPSARFSVLAGASDSEIISGFNSSGNNLFSFSLVNSGNDSALLLNDSAVDTKVLLRTDDEVSYLDLFKLGIGSTTPSAKLTVQNTSSDNSFVVEDSASDSTPFVIDESGNVGIGTTDPIGIFNINTTNTVIQELEGSGSVTFIDMNNTNTGETAFRLQDNGSVNWIYGNDADNSDAFQISAASAFGSNDYLTINRTLGNVGIASTSPEARFVVENTDAFDSFVVSDEANDSTPFVIDGAGAVGIGTLNPVGAFNIVTTNTVIQELEGSGSVTFIDMNNTNTGETAFRLQDNGSGRWIFGNDADNSDAFQISAASAFGTNDFFTIENVGGDVGIGTSTPEHDLDVDGDFRVGESGNADAFFVDATNGRVGVGTTTLNEKFTLAGGNFLQESVTDPTIEGSILTDGTNLDGAAGVHVMGRYAYVASIFGDSLAVIDISDPANPEVVGSVTDATNLNGATSVRVAGRYAYTVGESGTGNMAVVDVSDPTNPFVAGSVVDSDLTNAKDIRVAGRYAYAVADTSDNFVVVDIASSTNPTIVATLNDSTNLNGAKGLHLSGDYAYVAGDAGDLLSIVDISDPENPVIVGTVTDATELNGAFNVFVSGRFAYVPTRSGSGFTIIDVSDPTNPTITGSIVGDSTNLSFAQSVHVSGKYAYVGTLLTDSVTVIDVSSSTNPVVVSALIDNSALNAVNDVYVSGKYAYAVSQADNFVVVDISGIDAPSASIGALQTENINVASELIASTGMFNTSLNVGKGGIQTDGSLSVNGTTTDSFFEGGLGIGTTTPFTKFGVTGTVAFDGISTGSGNALHILANGEVVENVSSQAFKNDITSIDFDTQNIYDLNPVSFTWNEKSAISGTRDFGLIAEEVAETIPQLATYSATGTPRGVRYDMLSVLNLGALQAREFTLDVSGAGTSTPTLQSLFKGQTPALFVNETGSIGINTSNPTHKLSIEGDAYITDMLSVSDLTASGTLTLSGIGEGAVPFIGEGGVISQEVQHFVWDAAHNRLGVGTTTPQATLHVSTTTDATTVRIGDADGTCDLNPEAGTLSISCSSDQDLKEDIVEAPSLMETFMAMRVREYAPIASPDERMIGVIAQEMLTDAPDFVNLGEDGLYKVRQPSAWELVKLIQEAQLSIEALEETLPDTVFENGETIWQRLENLATAFVNGTLSILRINVERAHVAEELCIDDVCIDKEELQALLQQVGEDTTSSEDSTPTEETPAEEEESSSSSGGGDGSSSPSEETPAEEEPVAEETETPAEEPAPESAPEEETPAPEESTEEPVAEETETPAEEPAPEPTPEEEAPAEEPTPEPELEPEPEPEPAPEA